MLFTDAESNWIGELATEVPTLENGGVSEDGLTITYKLRDGVTWHDGEPVTSADVKATWEMIMNPDYAVITRFGYDRIGSVETPDPLTVVVNFAEPFASWPILFDAIIPKHVIDANADDLDNSEAMRQPVGFGPFRSSRLAGRRVDRVRGVRRLLARPTEARPPLHPHPPQRRRADAGRRGQGDRYRVGDADRHT